jgi:lysophospholipase L1-like esterase
LTKKILFLGDSLGLPRPDMSVIDSDTWCHLTSSYFKKNYEIDFYYQLNGGLHTRRLISIRRRGYLAGYVPNIVILQVGIVDCASRVLSERMVNIISVIPIINVLVKKFIGKFHKQLLRLRTLTYVSKNEFEFNLKAIKSSFNDCIFIIIPIAPPIDAYIDFMPRLRKNIKIYNSILENVFPNGVLKNLFDNIPLEKLFLEDHHHLSNYGHKIVSDKVIEKLKEILIN